MLYNKMRPHTFDGIIGQEPIIKSLRGQSIAGQFFSLYILEGQYGSGKTTTARILALAANCLQKDGEGNPCLQCRNCKAILSANSSDYMEVDAASNTGVEKARQLIEDVSYMPSSLEKKIYIIDEAHMLSKAAFNSLLKTLEDTPEYAIFILCTTEKDAIPPTIQSRAASYTFRKIPEGAILGSLREIGAKEYPGAALEPDALAAIAAHSGGSMRDALSIMEQAATCGGVTLGNVTQMLGVASTQELLALAACLANCDIPGSIQKASSLIESGRGMLPLTAGLLRILQDAAVASVSGDASLISGAPGYRRGIKEISGAAGTSRICGMIESMLQLRSELRNSQSEAVFTCSMVKICAPAHGGMAALERRIEALEQKAGQPAGGGAGTQGRQSAPCASPAEGKAETGTTPEAHQEPAPFSNEDLLRMFGLPGARPDSLCPADRQGTQTPDAQGAMQGSQDAQQAADKSHGCHPDAQKTLRRIRELEESDPAFWSAAEEGSKCLVMGSRVEYHSPLKPVCRLMEQYFKMHGIPSKACFDPSVKI